MGLAAPGSGESGRYAPNTMNINRAIMFWGLLDIGSIGWYILWNIFHGEIPFYADIISSVELVSAFEHSIPVFITVTSLLLSLTLIPSGYLLIKLKPFASKIVYFQTPFRLITLIPPSVFFITWPLKYIFKEPGVTLAYITFAVLLLLSESLKVVSVVRWRKQMVLA